MALLRSFDLGARREKGRLIIERVPSRFSSLFSRLGGKREGPTSFSFPPRSCYVEALRRRGVKIDGIERAPRPKLLEGESLSRLYPFQVEAVEFLVGNPFRGALLALSQGLGKTAVAIESARQLDAKHILVICPLTLCTNWDREIGKWSGETAQIIRSSDKVPPSRWTVTNYERLRASPGQFDRTWDLVIFDESIRLKNRQTATFRAAKSLRTKTIWLLSGSPISQNLSDLWTQFHLIDPKAFTSFWRFVNEYCIVDETIWGKNIVGSVDLDYQTEFRDTLYVVNQDDVLDLPEMRFQSVFVDLATIQRRMYQQALDEFILELSTGKLPIASRIAQITRLQQIVSNVANLDPTISSSGKLTALYSLVEGGEVTFPAIVWVHWREGSRQIVSDLRGLGHTVELISGSEGDREEILQRYLRGEIDVLVLSMGVGKFGLTLTNTRTMVYFDRTFDFDAYVQSLYRVRRIGLTHSPLVISLVASGTIDELVNENLAGKALDLTRLTNSSLRELLEALRTRSGV